MNIAPTMAAAAPGEEEVKILSHLIKEYSVFLGGGSLGKGLKKAATHYLTAPRREPDHFSLEGANDLNEHVDRFPREDSFYVVDIGVLISQMYQCKYCILLRRGRRRLSVEMADGRPVTFRGRSYDC
jgi:hypothetical protein